ncbi:hypothetical protein KP509_06G012200 [Ceratopteris richardii]|uniref:Fungal lipase-type domain-containing protein n=1 Tax=Ceratopteris richardii TaxID=49495 RepID=A0A8T2UFS7_CERRI|nr:hypothetical protein KP509_06G012000 [Ceratopteris richardii]KAH7434333.1 hypothetical protein KP509_06G012100 [Ceratopteris richardii]KAH7434334.1 hypothetical protein KP509_06G012200 [Ceratopteris richardii]
MVFTHDGRFSPHDGWYSPTMDGFCSHDGRFSGPRRTVFSSHDGRFSPPRWTVFTHDGWFLLSRWTVFRTAKDGFLPPRWTVTGVGDTTSGILPGVSFQLSFHGSYGVIGTEYTHLRFASQLVSGDSKLFLWSRLNTINLSLFARWTDTPMDTLSTDGHSVHGDDSYDIFSSVGSAFSSIIHLQLHGKGKIIESDDDDADKEDPETLQSRVSEIHPLLKLAMEAYSDNSLAGNPKFPFVRKSRLVTDVKQPSELFLGLRTDTQVHVCLLEDGSLAFVFRGTETLRLRSILHDMATDALKIQDIVYDGSREQIKVHKGFLLALHDVTKTSRKDENIRLVADGLGVHADNVRRVICIGHSLGGALATLCAHWCRHVGYPRAEIWCVTIGSPRVGNHNFAADFKYRVVTKKRSYRVVNKGDIISHVPRISVACPYKHVCGRIHLLPDSNRKGKIAMVTGRSGFLIPRITHHFPLSYAKTITKALDQSRRRTP